MAGGRRSDRHGGCELGARAEVPPRLDLRAFAGEVLANWYAERRMDENEISAEAERAGMLAALHAIVVGTLSTLKRKGLLTGQELDQLFEAGLITFERGEQDETRQAARITLEILARSLRDPPEA